MSDPWVALGALIAFLVLTTWVLFRLIEWLRRAKTRYFFFDLFAALFLLGFGLMFLSLAPRSGFSLGMGIMMVVAGGTGLGALLNQRFGTGGPTGTRYSLWKKLLRCSFCNKSQRDVQKLIAGPNVYICDECVAICLTILKEEGGHEPEPEGTTPDPLPS
jgi:hypothetical protein